MVLPISFFERDNQAFYNSIAIIDADGEVLGVYRKSHIPDGPGYEEKFYFSPGDTGFKVWDTKYCKLGVAICWDQWFPEAARIMALMGAEVLMYPTAIGSEPQDHTLVSSGHWRRTMQGHSAANYVPVVASNRIGEEFGDHSSIMFYGTSFITGPTGEVVEDAGRRARERKVRRRGQGGRGADAHVRSRSDRGGARQLGNVPRSPAAAVPADLVAGRTHDPVVISVFWCVC